MFTGLVDKTQNVTSVIRKSDRAVLTITNDVDMQVGDSVAVDGCCLTVTRSGKGFLEFDVSTETLAKTHFNTLVIGQKINVERPLCIGSRLHGHLVTGHIDGTAVVVKIEETEESTNRMLTVAMPVAFDAFLVTKGSVALNGVSLTINSVEVHGDEVQLQVCLIPETLQKTNFSDISPRQSLNFEIDIVSKHLHKLVRESYGHNKASN